MAQGIDKTLIIDNFKGSMTAFVKGDINSGFASVFESGGYNPFIYPGSLTWSNAPTRIDPTGSVITDLIVAGKERVENGILYVYAIGHTGRLYKIQVNDPTTYNPDYDKPVLLTTLTSQTPTFTRGGFMDFYGSTERIYIGHDKGVTRIDFAGNNETFIGSTSSWAQNVPRPFKQFVGKLYCGNGANLAEIDTTNTVTSYTKFSPGFPDNTQARDIDLSPDGTYLEVVVSRLPLGDITSTTQDTSITANQESYIIRWNGTDATFSSYSTFPSFSIGANIMFQNYQYTFGRDQYGAAVFNPLEKMFTLQEMQVPLPNAISSTGNLVNWMGPLSFDGYSEVDFLTYGTLDFETGPGYWDLFWQGGEDDETDVIRVPFQMPVSNLGLGGSTNGYVNTRFGSSKIYYSTMETSETTTAYKLHKWSPSIDMREPTAIPLNEAVYQTQTQMFSKKVNVSEVRIYGMPWVDGNSFKIDLIGSDMEPITGASRTYTAGSELLVGTDYVWYNPNTKPTYAIAVRITNLGTSNFVINKIELDINQAGK